MTIGELRKILENQEDDAKVVLDTAPGDFQIDEVWFDKSAQVLFISTGEEWHRED